MPQLNSQHLGIDILDSILSGYKTDMMRSVPRINISSDVIHSYLQELATKLLNDRRGMYSVISHIKIEFTAENIESQVTTIKIRSKNDHEVATICDAHGILPSEIDDIVIKQVQNAFNSYVYKLEEDENLSNEEAVHVKLYKGFEVENAIKTQSNAWDFMLTLKCKRPNFSKAIAIHDEFKKRFMQGQIVEKQFIDEYLAPFVTQEDGSPMNFDAFISTFTQNLVFAYEFIAYFVDLCYSRDLKKKQ